MKVDSRIKMDNVEKDYIKRLKCTLEEYTRHFETVNLGELYRQDLELLVKEGVASPKLYKHLLAIYPAME